MGKSLKDLLKDDSEDKDLGSLLKRFEESYIYKALDWVDKSFRLSKYYPNSKLAKGLDFTKDFMFYANVLGYLPTKKQEKYAEHLGYDKLKFTRYSLIFGFSADVVRFAGALCTPPPIAFGLYTWGFVMLAEDCTRLAYVLIKKRPVGSFVYVEIPYRILRPVFKYINKLFSKKVNNLKINPYINFA